MLFKFLKKDNLNRNKSTFVLEKNVSLNINAFLNSNAIL